MDSSSKEERLNVGQNVAMSGFVYPPFGRLFEWFKKTVLKIVIEKSIVGSNPTSSE